MQLKSSSVNSETPDDSEPNQVLSRQQMRKALKVWPSTQKLGQHPFATLRLVQQRLMILQESGGAIADTPAGRGVVLRVLLQELVDSQRPLSTEPDYSLRTWRLHTILQRQFLEKQRAGYLREELGLSESGYFNDQRLALDRVLERLQEWEIMAQSEIATSSAPVAEQNRADDTPSLPTHWLPQATTPFWGREAERQQIGELLAQGKRRLITLTGPGGIGKTRLALQVAHEAYAENGRSSYFIPLDTIDSPELIAPTIAQLLQFNLDTQTHPQRQVIDFLRQRELLLILDNFEHLVDGGAAFVQALLMASSGVQIVTTSRERLNLRGEWVLALDGLAIPGEPHQAWHDTAAWQLFVDGLHRVGREQALDEAEETAVVEICQLVAGMPLALELASSWGRVLTCQEIAAEIRKNVDFLASSFQDLPPRHRSLRAVFWHSWQLLSASEQAVFCQLAIFPGSFDRWAVQAVAQTDLSQLYAIFDKSLLRLNENGRLSIHPLLRQFATEKLQEQPELAADVAARHAQYYADMLQEQTPALRQGGQQRATLEKLTSELENLRTAWRWLVTHRQIEILADSMEGFYLFYRMTNRVQEGVAMVAMAQTTLSAEQTTPTTASQRLDALLMGINGRWQQLMSQSKQAQSSLSQSLIQLQRWGNPREKAFWGRFGIQANLAEPGLRPQELYEACRAYFAAQQDEWGIAQTQIRYVSYLRDTGATTSYHQQKALLQDSLTRQQRIGDEKGIANSFNLLGNLAYERGDYEEARRHAEESLAINERLGDELGRGLALNNLGQVAGTVGDYQLARIYYEESLAIQRDFGNPREVAVMLDCVGYTTYLAGELEAAENSYLESYHLSEQIEDVHGMAWSLHNLGDVARARQEYAQAEDLYQQSRQLHIQLEKLSWGGAVSLDKLGRVRVLMGKTAVAQQDFLLALDIAQQTNRYREMLDALLNLARLQLEDGQRDMAAELLHVIIHHPATAQETKETAVVLATDLPPITTPSDLNGIIQKLLHKTN